MNDETINTFDMSVLEKARMLQGWTYKTLAAEAGGDYDAVRRLLKRKRKSNVFRNPELIKKIAFALGLSLEQVVKTIESPQHTA